MILGVTGTLPDGYADLIRQRFPDLEVRVAGSDRIDALFSWAARLDDVAGFLERQPDLPWIHIRAAGVPPRLLAALDGRPTLLTNGSGAQGPAVAEHVVAVVLAFYKDLFAMRALQARREWSSSFAVRELRGQTVGLVGLGSIGGSTARLLRPFGVRLRALRRKREPSSDVDEVYTRPELDRFLDDLDVLVIAAPLTAETRLLIGAAEVQRLRRGALLVNVGRGAIVEEAALLDALWSGQLGGAALDVFETEPLSPESPFWSMPNVLVSPHCGDSTPQSPERSLAVFLDNLARFRSGAPLLNVVDRERGY